MIIASWIATSLSIIGAILNAKKSIHGYWVWIISNLLWMVLALIRQDIAQAVLWIVYVVISIYGIYCWAKKGKKDETNKV